MGPCYHVQERCRLRALVWLAVGEPLRQRERKVECTARAECTFGPKLTVVSVDDAFCDEEAESASASARRFGMPEAVEDMGQVVGRDPAPSVRDRKARNRVSAFYTNTDRAAFLRKLNR